MGLMRRIPFNVKIAKRFLVLGSGNKGKTGLILS